MAHHRFHAARVIVLDMSLALLLLTSCSNSESLTPQDPPSPQPPLLVPGELTTIRLTAGANKKLPDQQNVNAVQTELGANMLS